MTKGHDKRHNEHMSDREVMKLALEALESASNNEGNFHDYKYAAEALRQALDHVPDTTKMTEPDMGIDRGAWDDVPDATKWVDELRGGDETEEEPVAFVCRGKLSTIGHCEECKPLYAAPPRREWVGLTDEEREYLWGITPIEDEDRFAFVLAVEAKLKEKNTCSQ